MWWGSATVRECHLTQCIQWVTYVWVLEKRTHITYAVTVHTYILYQSGKTQPWCTVIPCPPPLPTTTTTRLVITRHGEGQCCTKPACSYSFQLSLLVCTCTHKHTHTHQFWPQRTSSSTDAVGTVDRRERLVPACHSALNCSVLGPCSAPNTIKWAFVLKSATNLHNHHTNFFLLFYCSPCPIRTTMQARTVVCACLFHYFHTVPYFWHYFLKLTHAHM